MLDENCPVVTPTPEGAGMFYTEQNKTPRDSLAPEKPESSVEIQPFAESHQALSPIVEESSVEGSSREAAASDSVLESFSMPGGENDSDLESVVAGLSLEKSSHLLLKKASL